MSSKHTPGPWDVADAWIVGPDVTGVHPDVYLAEVVTSDELGRCADEDTRWANMRLMALAPEMFDFIEGVASGNTEYDLVEQMARELLARVK